ncbi:U1 small nuclear ribonucleoprotein of 70kDa MW N terminal-domain-containing protein [Calycina marina]|uniref:U1 small nuclear ribonucleoprotein of 70kDa MW N terminal-domain-containing protein n=1 Tax=Calycina marina TaxID=1763456 RepID=A0A9P7ZBK1_9HELO|nr:U1 small nuclear ribonucleoprotein of 70kDa MW N terminal-domain-containing protein [Calycina marina]
MTDKLPPNLLVLFAPRPALRWVPPSDHAPEERKTATITGLASFLPPFEEYKQTDQYTPSESWLQRKDRVKLEKKQQQEKLLEEGPVSYKPQEDPNIRGDAFKTLIVARLSYDATEKDLESEFGRFGPIERIRIVVDTKQYEKPNKKKKNHRGYAFVVFEREKDMRGNTNPLPIPTASQSEFQETICTDMALMLPIYSFISLPCSRYIKYEQKTDNCTLLALCE